MIAKSLLTKLREVAKNATQGHWYAKNEKETIIANKFSWTSCIYRPNNYSPAIKIIGLPIQEQEPPLHKDALFISTFEPDTVLKLIDEVENVSKPIDTKVIVDNIIIALCEKKVFRKWWNCRPAHHKMVIDTMTKIIEESLQNNTTNL